jgi:hypothetical protein
MFVRYVFYLFLQEKLMDPMIGPVAVQNRTALSVWFCNLHNKVGHVFLVVDASGLLSHLECL